MASDALMIDGEAIAKGGEAVAASTFPVPCCCGGCYYWRATLCNETICPGAVRPDIFVCTTFECGGEPLHDGQVIRYGNRCYTVRTNVLYCPQNLGPRSRSWAKKFVDWMMGLQRGGPIVVVPETSIQDCVPLPNNAIIGDDSFVCIPTCTPANGCTPIDGWFTMVACPCPGVIITGNLISYVCCSAYLNALGNARCPVWTATTSTGQPVCATVRPGTNPTSDPQAGAELICRVPDHLTCCTCCSHNGGVGCCYSLEIHTRITYTNNVATQVFLEETQCCWSVQEYNATGSFSAISFFELCPGGGQCPVRVRTTTLNGRTAHIEDRTYNQGSGECPPCGGPTSTTIEDVDITCMSAGTILSLATAGFAGGNGVIEWDCGHATANTIYHATSGVSSSVQGSVSITGGSACGEFDCNPLSGGRTGAIAFGDFL